MQQIIDRFMVFTVYKQSGVGLGIVCTAYSKIASSYDIQKSKPVTHVADKC